MRQNSQPPTHGKGFADTLRECTRPYHAQAEKSGVLHEILQGRADRVAYTLLLGNLLPVYQQLEDGLQRHRHKPVIALLAEPCVYRVAALSADFAALGGVDRFRRFPVLPAAARYAERIAVAAEFEAALLIAHAYTRFLGDLNGGRILRRLLGRNLGLGPDMLRFYEYPGVDTERFKTDYRSRIDSAAADTFSQAQVIDEAILAFRLNIALSQEVSAFVVREYPS